MILGILSDTHDNLRTLADAFRIFRAGNVGQILHAGDWVSPFTVAAVAGEGIPFIGVFGNNDGDKLLLDRTSGGRILRPGASLELDGWRTLILHEPDNLDALAASGRFRLIVHGHDHRPLVTRAGATLIVNPGECGGWLHGTPTAATVDTRTGESLIHTLA